MDETTTPAAPEVDSGTSYDEAGAAQALLARWNKASEPEKPATEEAPEPQAQADVEPEAEPVADAEPEADFEFDVGGTKLKLPKAFEETLRPVQAKVKEIEAGATRKFQEAAELRKATEAERAAVAEMRKLADVHADLIADARTVARRMQQIEGLDFSAVEPDQVARINAEYTQLSALSRRLETTLKDGIEQHRAKEQEALRARQEHAQRIVEQRIKGWGPEMQKELAEYAVSRGAPVEALNGISEPWMVEILADAAYGRKMREHKSTQEKRVVQTPLTVKPGSAATGQPSAKAKAEEAMSLLRKSGRTEDAAAVLLARMRRK